jgi:hypothetical protein
MEQPHDSCRQIVNGGKVTAFVPIAHSTRPREILKLRQPTMLACNDVIGLVWLPCIFLMQEAILAPTAGADTNLGTER